MMDTISAWIAAIWTGLTLFVASNIEPMPGVWVAAISGSLLSSFTGPDKSLGRLFFHIVLAILVGVFSSQIIGEIFTLKIQARVAESFFCALFAEKIVAGIHNGSLLKAIVDWRQGK